MIEYLHKSLDSFLYGIPWIALLGGVLIWSGRIWASNIAQRNQAKEDRITQKEAIRLNVEKDLQVKSRNQEWAICIELYEKLEAIRITISNLSMVPDTSNALSKRIKKLFEDYDFALHKSRIHVPEELFVIGKRISIAIMQHDPEMAKTLSIVFSHPNYQTQHDLYECIETMADSLRKRIQLLKGEDEDSWTKCLR